MVSEFFSDISIEKRQIALIDLDYFFAQCEVIRNPSLVGKPVVIVVPTIRGSGAVATCNYEARKLKIRSGMALSLAKKLSGKDTIFIDIDKKYYSSVSSKVFEIIDFFCEKTEQSSIDEAYLDLTNPMGFEKAEEICLKIKSRIKADLNLTCSIGLSFNKLLAKMASEEKKPDGFFKVLPEQKDSFLLKKRLKDIYGLGQNAEFILRKIGVNSISDLRNLRLEKLVELFGSSKGNMFYYFSRGIDDRSIIVNREKKQISRMITLKNDSNNFEDIKFGLDMICEIVFNESQKTGKIFKTCSLIVITNKFETITKSKSFSERLDLDSFKKMAYFLLEEFLNENSVLVRRVGFRVSNFDEGYGSQRKIFEF